MSPSGIPEIVAQFPRGFEIIILLVIVAIILLLGPKKIPELARGIGKAIGEFRKGRAQIEKEIKLELAETPSSPKARTLGEVSPKILDAAEQLSIEVLGRKERDLKVAIIKALDAATGEKLESVAEAMSLKARGLDLDQLKDSIVKALGI